LAVDTSYIAVGFYIYQEDINDPKRHYYAKFGLRNLNDCEARFSQPKRELFGLKDVLRLIKKWLIATRKLIVETDAKYIKGMLENSDMMPNSAINKWISEILMYHFTIRHKASKTFGPDGLSRQPKQPSDPPIDVDSTDEDDELMPGPPEVIIANPSEIPPLKIEDFVDSIDTRGRYYQGIVKSIEDFREELSQALVSRDIEKKVLERI